jgi:hypothetical protein
MIALTAVPTARQYVDLRVSTDAPGTAPILVERTMQGRTRTVRGGDQVTDHGGGLVLADWEIVYQAPLTYQATCNGQSTTATAVLPEGRAWLRSVLNPGTSVPLGIGGIGAEKRPARRTLFRPVGRRNAVALTDVRAGREGDGLTATTFTAAEFDALTRLLESGDVLLLTGPGSWGLGPLYCTVGDYEVSRPGDLAATTVRRWVLPFVEVDPPPGYVPPPGQTWGQIKAKGLTWGDLKKLKWQDITFPPSASTARREVFP